MENVEMVQTVRNCRGIEIKKWCGSCKHKSQDKQKTGRGGTDRAACDHFETDDALQGTASQVQQRDRKRNLYN